jgi:beta-mannosidase
LAIFSNFGERFCAIQQQLSSLSSEIMAQERLFRLSKHLQLPSPQRKLIPIDDGWHFKQQDENNLVSSFRPVAMFPTTVHLDLLAHNLIPDPFAGTNESKEQWVGEKSWVYRCSFTVPLNELDNFQYASLIFEGLDAFCNVKMDGNNILKSDNMYISNRIDVRELLRRKEEHPLELVFHDATGKGQLKMKKHPQHTWGSWNGDPSRTAVRKAQYHYVSHGSLKMLHFANLNV